MLPFGGDASGESVQVELVTFGPGDAVHQYFGHSAMIVRDKTSGRTRLYNFGMFSFGPAMLPNFLSGRLWFWVATTPTEATLRHYRDANRSIHIQVLNLPPSRRAELATALERAILPENRDYLFDHYRDNCSTRLRDLIDDSVDGALGRAMAQPARMSYRGHTRRYAAHDALLDFLLVLWMNDQMEEPITGREEAFLPAALEQFVDDLNYRGAGGRDVPLVARKQFVFEAERAPVPFEPPTRWPHALFFGLVLGGLAWSLGGSTPDKGRWRMALNGIVNIVAATIVGLPGLVLFLMATFTEHGVTKGNENLLFANPFGLVALLYGVSLLFGKTTGRRWAQVAAGLLALGTMAAVVLKVLPGFDQENLLVLALYLPLNFGVALAHYSGRADWRCS